MATVGDVVARAVHGGDPANVDIGAAPPKSTFVEQRTITGAAGTASTVDLYACDGAIGVTRLLGTGEQQFEEPVDSAPTSLTTGSDSGTAI